MLEQSCKAGQVSYCVSLGLLYRTGTGGAEDRSRAVQLFQQACGDGNAQACAELGRDYWTGSGVAEDDQRAVELFTKACKEGALLGCTLLGQAYRDGHGVPQNPGRAAELFEQACRDGDRDACLQDVISPRSILIFSGLGMVPEYSDVAMRQLCFAMVEVIAEQLREELIQAGIPADLILSTDPDKGPLEIWGPQLSRYPYEEFIQLSVGQVDKAGVYTLTLLIVSNRLQSALAPGGVLKVTVKKAGTTKAYPLYSTSGKDQSKNTLESFAKDFARAYRARRPAR